jgi:hypothetical protein
MIIPESLPRIKQFLRPISRSLEASMLVQLMTAFITHVGRMSASQAAGAIRAASRHRGNVARYLGRKSSVSRRALPRLSRRIIASELRRKGQWFFAVDSTFCCHQGEHGENMFSCGNRKPRKRNSNRRQRKCARHACHGFVVGMLITPRGCRIPFFDSYLTREYCREKGCVYRTQAMIASDLIRELPVPDSIRPIVLGDTAFDAEAIRKACDERGFTWITPVNPERVLVGSKPRKKVSSLGALLKPGDLASVRLIPGHGPLAAQHRAASCRCGPRTHHRTVYVHGECRRVLHVGEVRLVFSTTDKPKTGQAVEIQKTLMTNDAGLSNRRVVQCYDLRWQIELLFRELKSTLGLDHYQFRTFVKVERFVTACLVTFLYLEWHRWREISARGKPAKEKKRCAEQRTYGLCRQVRLAAETNDLRYLARCCGTKTGLAKMKKTLQHALPTEYRIAQ